jgi:hypothetical protein
MDLQEYAAPLVFDQVMFQQALDNYDQADPHRRADEIDDRFTAPVVNAPLYDTSITNPIRASNKNIDEFPDFSDEVMSDYRMALMLGKQVEIPRVVDLDTAPDYVDFIKNSITSVIRSENEFNIANNELTEGIKKYSEIFK